MPKTSGQRPAVTRALEASERFQQRMLALHAAEFTTLDITMAQAKLLYVLSAEGELNISEIARRLGVSVSTASSAVDHLVNAGLLTRSDDPNNRRQVRVSVTVEGSDTLERMRDMSTRHMRLLFEQVSDDDLAVVERATMILAEAAAAVSAVPASEAVDRGTTT